MVEITDSNAGSSHLLSIGEELLVRLPENPTTGFRWQFTQSGSGKLKMMEDRFEAGGVGAPTSIGAAGNRVLRFSAERSGPVVLEAVEGREWEPASPNRKKKSFSIVVR